MHGASARERQRRQASTKHLGESLESKESAFSCRDWLFQSAWSGLIIYLLTNNKLSHHSQELDYCKNNLMSGEQNLSTN